ncbi:PhzF family phenazine biosynthesis protein [Paenibacillus filicis]|uniref:PhzF family phenazine biosynthesis protein n=1 Tax=Paenibacillus gyeongsangnamensis TaxID=3388067 RepID=A0ABT4QEN8_9BACL|nr:PhzF family phenazine biosynthesis protein [Paenibacillus filicis]MCZ8515326.1 PhzF family phenazine biosynthesis protein [Paenibacillus filicis]
MNDDMIESLGVKPVETYLSRDLMFVLEDEEQVRQLKPDFSKLKQLSDGLGVHVTAKGRTFDFVARSFFPK